MKNIVYFVVLLTCYQLQATLGDAVDFANQLAHEYNKEKSTPRKVLVAKHNDMHPAEKLGREFVNGFAKAMVPAGMYVTYQASHGLYHDGSITFPDILCVNKKITLLSIGVALGDCMSAAGTLIASDKIFLFDIVQGIALSHCPSVFQYLKKK